MAAALKEDYQRALNEQKKEVRGLVIAGLEQVKKGRTKDFNTVCDRLEKKYSDEAISNQVFICPFDQFDVAGISIRLVTLLDGGEVPEVYYTTNTLVTAENVEDFE